MLCRGRMGSWAWPQCGIEPGDFREDVGDLDENNWSTGSSSSLLNTQVGVTQMPWGHSAAGAFGGSCDLKVAIRNQSWETCDEPSPTRWCGAAVPRRGPKAAKGGRVAAAGSGHRARPGEPGRGFVRRA